MHIEVVILLEVLGLIAFAVSGALAAFKKDLDLVGFIIVGTLTGIGGGTVRDVVLDRPVFWLHDPYLYSLNICIASAIITYVVSKFIEKKENIVNWFDATGLALFAVQGYMITISVVNTPEVAICMGVITGCGGGLLRDITLNRQPFIFRGELYATTAVAGLIVMWLTQSALLAFVLIFFMRACTILYKWRLK